MIAMYNYKEAKDLLSTGETDFDGLKSESTIKSAEKALGLRFPPSYRQFLLDFGCGDFNGIEIYGIIDDNFESSSAPNGVWLTLNERSEISLDSKYIIIGSSGSGEYFAIDALDVDDFGEGPVVLLSPNGYYCMHVAASFGAYLLGCARSVR